MMKYALLIILVVLISCTGDDLTNMEVPLKGKWVSTSNPTDILTFKSLDGKKIMVLEREKEMINGQLLPKIGSGWYDYDLLSDDILALRSMLSSNSNFHEYYFERSGDILTVEKFFEIESPGEILTFKRVD